jgi:hypothetical protein
MESILIGIVSGIIAFVVALIAIMYTLKRRSYQPVPCERPEVPIRNYSPGMNFNDVIVMRLPVTENRKQSRRNRARK